MNTIETHFYAIAYKQDEFIKKYGIKPNILLVPAYMKVAQPETIAEILGMEIVWTSLSTVEVGLK